MRKFLLLHMVWVFCAFTASAQTLNPGTVTVNLSGEHILKLIQAIEEQSSYRFYYNPIDLDSVTVTVQSSGLPVDEVLLKALAGTEIRHAIDPKENIFLTKGYSIRTIRTNQLAAINDYGKTNVTIPQTPVTEEGDTDDLFFNRREVERASSENRLYEIGAPTGSTRGTAKLTGYVTDAKTGEPAIGVAVFTEDARIGTSTDNYGFYTLTLPRGRHELYIEGVGMKNTKRIIQMNNTGRLDIQMEEQVYSLEEIVVQSDRMSNIRNTMMGAERVQLKEVKNIPSVFGETDILKVVLALPGVKSAGEASAGFNVRGGSTDQNLILFNDGTIYNPTHLFGFFSAFNSDLVKDIELYKSSIPSKYGGRLSSVLEVNSREGNKNKITGSAGIGLLTTRLNIEGPIIKDKTTFIAGGRITYSDWILKQLPEKSGYKRSSAGFYDFNAQITHKFNEKNTIYVNGYYSRDRFKLNSDTLYRYSNTNASIKWRSLFGEKFTGVFTAGYDRYDYNVESDVNPVNAYKMDFDINQLFFKADLTQYISTNNTLNYGLNTIYYSLHPGAYLPNGAESLVDPRKLQKENALESALYVEDQWNITPQFSATAGIRYSMFNALGARTYNTYASGQPKSEETITGTVTKGSGDFFKTYGGPEFRISARYAFSNDFSIKAGYNTLRQYIHMISNTTVMSPTDIWKLSDYNIKPQRGDQMAFGLYKNFKNNTIEMSLEGYYKRMHDFLDYKSGAVLVMNPTLETDVVQTKGRSYGVELMIKKMTGRLNGWISYAYSRTELRQNDPTKGALINNGDWYPANFDKPHEVKMVGNFKFTHRFSMSMNLDYSTGRPITLPVAKYNYGGGERVYYSERNAYRIPDYFRVDLSVNIEPSHHLVLLTHSSINIGVYNITGRKNAYSIYYVTEDGKINGYKMSIFGSPIPYINYNIKF